MPSSTVRRERLVSPLSLAVIIGLFILAFVLLKPAVDTFSVEQADNDASTNDIDDLHLAYLRARQRTGDFNVDEVRVAVDGLISNGELVKAKELLDNAPQINLGDSRRFEIDFAIASEQYNNAQTPTDRASTLTSVLSLTDKLLAQPKLQSTDSVAAALDMNVSIGQVDNITKLYAELARSLAESPQDSRNYHLACTASLSAIQEHPSAVVCAREGLAYGQTPDEKLPLHTALIRELTQLDDRVSRQVYIDEVMSDMPNDTESLTSFATVLLQAERPEEAYRVYAQLADRDEANREKWLEEASRWAEAANKPAESAVFLSTLAQLKTGDEKVLLQDRVQALLMGAGDTSKALGNLKIRMQEFPEDASVAATAIAQARQLGDNEQAIAWNAELLERYPDNQTAIALQIELALASGDLALAQQWTRRASIASPEDSDKRVQAARVAEWSGNPNEAAEHWQWLAENQSDRSSLSEHARVAELTRLHGQAAYSVRRLTVLHEPSEADVLRLVKLYELQGQPHKAAEAIEDIIKIHGEQPFYYRTLAALHHHHVNYDKALAVWDRYVENYGRSVEETLQRMELNWRTQHYAAAALIAENLKNSGGLSIASDYQILIMSEIGWRYNKPWLTMMAQPLLASVENKGQSAFQGRRVVMLLSELGRNDEAYDKSVELWRETGDPDLAVFAMDLALRYGDQEDLEPFMVDNDQTRELRQKPGYWSTLASSHLKQQDATNAERAYRQALEIDPQQVASIDGLMWMYIGIDDERRIYDHINQYKDFADKQPGLWASFAVGYMQIGAATTSLSWFDRQIETIDTDYSMLLTYADALEHAGRSTHAAKVRRYTVQQLRPLLVEGADEDHETLLNQYAQLVSRYSGADATEAWVTQLLAEKPDTSTEKFWREDMAISWLMATQRQEHARLIMAKLHEERMTAPLWQNVAIALYEKDDQKLAAIIDEPGRISVGNQVLALRQLGRESEAYSLAEEILAQSISPSDRAIAESQYISLRALRPSYASAGVMNRSLLDLGIVERNVKVRHTLAGRNLGFAMALKQRELDSTRFDLTGIDVEQDVSVSMLVGNSKSGTELTAGIVSTEEYEISYANGRFYRRSDTGSSELAAEISYNEPVTNSSELAIGGKQSRASVSLDKNLSAREFLRVQADAKEISTRVAKSRVARGLGAEAELGIRGSFGSNLWATSVRAAGSQYDRVDELPEDLQLSPTTQFDSVLLSESSSLSLNASLSRGGLRGEYPQATSPRYYMNASVGQVWPANRMAFQFDAGAGIRVLGGDELSFSFTHDTQSLIPNQGDATTLGVRYRYHFK